jgi:hypothetical protein
MCSITQITNLLGQRDESEPVDPATGVVEIRSVRATPSLSRRRLRPLTDRILEALPGPRIVWACLWALVPWLNAGANLVLGEDQTSAVWEQTTVLIVLNYAAISFGVLLTLWGTNRVARRVERLRTSVASEPFGAINSVAGPVALAVLASLVFGGSALARDGWAAGFVRGGTWFILGVALFTFVWVYGSLLLGLN